MLGECDVFVCDGFTGNLVLKSCEGFGLLIMEMLKEVFLKRVLFQNRGAFGFEKDQKTQKESRL